MPDILLDYAFKVNINTPIPTVSTAWIRTPAVVVKPAEDVVLGIYEVTSQAQYTALTGNTDFIELFNRGINRFFVIVTDDLDISAVVNANLSKFFTLLIGAEWTQTDLGTKNFGTFKGVVAWSSDDDADITFLKSFAITGCGFYGTGKNMSSAFGWLLNGVTWQNRQYDRMPDMGITDETGGQGRAEDLFENRVSFVITSPELGNKLSFFATGKQAIVAPYVIEEIKVLLQSNAVTWINTNQPNYTLVNAKILEDEISKVFIPYIANDIIRFGDVIITLDEEQGNFEANGIINISEPKALWRVLNELYQV